MSRPRPKFLPEPRIWSRYQAASRLGKGEAWFADHRVALEKLGFPAFDEALGGYDSAAIEAWLDRRSGLAEADSDNGLTSRLQAFQDGELPRAPSR